MKVSAKLSRESVNPTHLFVRVQHLRGVDSLHYHLGIV